LILSKYFEYYTKYLKKIQKVNKYFELVEKGFLITKAINHVCLMLSYSIMHNITDDWLLR